MWEFRPDPSLGEGISRAEFQPFVERGKRTSQEDPY